MQKLILTLILVLCCSSAWGATYYVDKSCALNGDGTQSCCKGTGGACTGSAGAYNTIAAGLDSPPSGTHTINVAAGTYTSTVTITSNENNKTLNVVANGPVTVLTATSPPISVGSFETTNASVTFDGFTFQTSATGSAAGLTWSTTNHNAALKFSNCSFIPHNNNNTYAPFFLSSAPTSPSNRSLTLDKVVATGKGQIGNFFKGLAVLNVLNDSRITNPTVFTGSSNWLMHIGGPTGTVTVSDSSFVSGDGSNDGSHYGACGIIVDSTTTEISGIRIRNNTFSVGVENCSVVDAHGYSGVSYPVTIDKNEIDTGGQGITVGTESGVTAYDLGAVVVSNNIVRKHGPGNGHGMYLGHGLTNVKAFKNSIDVSSRTNEYGLVYKGLGASVYNNVVVGDYACTIKGGSTLSFFNNTCISSGTTGVHAALYLLNEPIAPTTNNFALTIKNNIFYTNTAPYSVYSVNPNTTYNDTILDNNLYRGGSIATFYNANINSYDLAGWRAYWAVNGSGSAINNDVNSISTDPILSSTYRPLPNSPAIGAGAAITGIHDQATPATDADGRIVHFLPPNIGAYDGRTSLTVTSDFSPTGYTVRGTDSEPAIISLGSDSLVVDLSGLTADEAIVVKSGSKKVKGFVAKGTKQYLKGSGGSGGSSGFNW